MRLDISEPSRVLACVVSPPSLYYRIRERQYDDPHLLVLQDMVRRGDARYVTIGKDGVMRMQGRICVPNVDGIRELNLEEVHSSRYSIHPGAANMYQVLIQHYWWRRMKKDIVGFVAKCLNCQQVKYEHHRPGGLLQRLEMPELLTTYSSERLAEIYIRKIVRLHGIPVSINSHRGTQFTSRFWRAVQQELGTRVELSTALHPHTNGQSEHTIQILEDMLHACLSEQEVVAFSQEVSQLNVQFQEAEAKWSEVQDGVLITVECETTSIERVNNLEAALSSKAEEVVAAKEKRAQMEDRYKKIMEHNKVHIITIRDLDLSLRTEEELEDNNGEGKDPDPAVDLPASPRGDDASLPPSFGGNVV
ncbi:uncharacterized protein [Nicotiana tomentosiformis]|uniref:uncharacterized protein n=1 Tax=Nicotiana tomentosiformis TaxID=4098 RepID=UPI00388C3F56